MLAGSLIALMLAASGAVSANENIDAKAQEVIERTRTTTFTHAVYYRTHSFLNGTGPKDWWSAVFHRGTLFRTEGAWTRSVADCAGQTGTQVALRVRKDRGNIYSVDPKYAKQACGISADREILSAKWLGQKPGRFGLTDLIEISEKKGSYIYSVGQRGEILGVTVTHRGDAKPIVTEAVLVEYQLPADDIFSRESLRHSIISKTFKELAAPR